MVFWQWSDETCYGKQGKREQLIFEIRTICAAAAEIYFDRCHGVTGGEAPECVFSQSHFIEFHIGHFPAVGADKMAVLLEVWAVAGGFAVDVNLAHESATHQGFQAIVNRGERDCGHALFGAKKYFRCSGMVALLKENVKDFASLRGHSQPPIADRFLVVLKLGVAVFHTRKVAYFSGLSRIIPKKD